MSLPRPDLSSLPIVHFPRPGGWADMLRSRLRSPDIDLGLVRAVLTQYPLRAAASLRNLPNTHRNRNMIAETAQGRHIVKCYRDDWQPATIIFEHSILGRLEQMGFPGPRLVPACDGQTWVAMEGRFFCLFEFISGTNYSSSFLVRPQRVRMMATAGQTLARLHRHLAGFLPAGQHHQGFRDYAGPRHRDLAWHAAAVDDLRLRSRGLTQPDWQAAAQWLDRASDALLEDMARLDHKLAGAGLPRVIIHGDYGLHNLIYHSLDRATPIDYELARIEWRLCDVVSVISKFRYKTGRYDLESIGQFLRAYDLVYPIGGEEWRLLPDVWKFYKLMKAVQYWRSFFETHGPLRKLNAAREEIVQSDWARSHMDALTALRGDR